MTGPLVWGRGSLGRNLRAPDVRGEVFEMGNNWHLELLPSFVGPLAAWSDARQNSTQPLPSVSLAADLSPTTGELASLPFLGTSCNGFFVLLAGASFVSKLVSELGVWDLDLKLFSLG